MWLIFRRNSAIWLSYSESIHFIYSYHGAHFDIFRVQYEIPYAGQIWNLKFWNSQLGFTTLAFTGTKSRFLLLDFVREKKYILDSITHPSSLFVRLPLEILGDWDLVSYKSLLNFSLQITRKFAEKLQNICNKLEPASLDNVELVSFGIGLTQKSMQYICNNVRLFM